MYDEVYPQIFLDANALVKVAYSISHHLRDSKKRKSALRLFMERGLITFSTGVLQFLRTLEILEEGLAETHRFVLDDRERKGVIIELLQAAAGERSMIEVVGPRDVQSFDQCRRSVHEELSRRWAQLASWDKEDMMMLYEASLAYTKYGIITTKVTCRPRPMILVTDDQGVLNIADELDLTLKEVMLSTPEASLLKGQYKYKIIYIKTYNQLKELIQTLSY